MKLLLIITQCPTREQKAIKAFSHFDNSCRGKKKALHNGTLKISNMFCLAVKMSGHAAVPHSRWKDKLLVAGNLICSHSL